MIILTADQIPPDLMEFFEEIASNNSDVLTVNTSPYPVAHFAVMPSKLVEPCVLAGSRPGDVILDPFVGAGTVPLVALQYHRSYIGIDLNPNYVELAKKRIETVQPVLWEEPTP